MEIKEVILSILAFSSIVWNIVQWVINRKLKKKDIIIDRRFDSYSSYSKKSDELMANLRRYPNMVYGITNDFLSKCISGNESDTNQALLEFNSSLMDFVRKASEPLMILKQELSGLRLICSKNLLPLISEYQTLATDFNDELQNVLASINLKDTQSMQEKLKTIGHDERYRKIETLNTKIIETMRNEL